MDEVIIANRPAVNRQRGSAKAQRPLNVAANGSKIKAFYQRKHTIGAAFEAQNGPKGMDR